MIFSELATLTVLQTLRGTVRYLCALMFLGVALAGRAEAWTVMPTVAGELQGRFKWRDAVALDWTLLTRSAADDERKVSFTLKDAATSLRATARVRAATGDGFWNIEQGRVDLGAWWQVLAPVAGAAAEGIIVEGNLTVSGEGEVVAGQPVGRVHFSVNNASARAKDGSWALAGIALEGDWDVTSGSAGAVPFTLAIRTVTTARFGARAVAVTGQLRGVEAIEVTTARVEIAGGDVVAETFTVSLALPVVNARLHMSRVGLQDVVALVPESGLASARGRIDGEVTLGWTQAEGFAVGAGRLALRDDEPTVLRLAPAPGFLTSRVPLRFQLLPGWAGPFARWFAPLNPAFASLQEIELGRADLRVQSLDVQLTPEGDAQGRNARVVIHARPEKAGGSVGALTFTINVAGPLNDVMRLGLKENLSFGGR
jgi:hypothetical protein